MSHAEAKTLAEFLAASPAFLAYAKWRPPSELLYARKCKWWGRRPV